MATFWVTLVGFMLVLVGTASLAYGLPGLVAMLSPLGNGSRGDVFYGTHPTPRTT
jgi:hypothetical protein